MPSLKELFKSQKLSNGQTAQQKYDIQNSKENKPTSANALMTAVAFPLQQIARRNLSAKGRETRFEEEVSGLRILSKVSSPIIYGTDIFRLTNKTTEVLNVMKAGSNNAEYTPSKIATAGVNLLNSLGVKLPQELIPSRIILDKNFKSGKEYNTMDTLLGIKAAGTGNDSGRFLKTNFTGTPDVKKLVGNTIQNLKSALNSILLQSPSQAAVNFAKDGGDKYNSASPYGKVMAGAQFLTEDLISKRNDLSSKYNLIDRPTDTTFVNFPKIGKTDI